MIIQTMKDIVCNLEQEFPLKHLTLALGFGEYKLETLDQLLLESSKEH